MPDLEDQNYLPLMEPGYMNLSPREASLISSGCTKTKLACHLKITNNKKLREKFSYSLFFNSD